MKKILGYRPSPAMVVAILAVLLACAGSATAARLITGKQIKNNSITSRDIKNRSLLKRDFKRGQLPRGPRGFQGAPGANGARGPAGANGFGLLVYASDAVTAANGESDTLFAVCPIGTFPTGGDAGANDEGSFDPSTDRPEVIRQQGLAADADGVPAGYYVDYDNTGASADVFVDAVCANASRLGAAARSHFRAHRRFDLKRPRAQR